MLKETISKCRITGQKGKNKLGGSSGLDVRCSTVSIARNKGVESIYQIRQALSFDTSGKCWKIPYDTCARKGMIGAPLKALMFAWKEKATGA